MRQLPPTARSNPTARRPSHVAAASHRRHITREQAVRVATAFLEAPRHSPTVTTASGHVRRPIRVVFTHRREPYATAAEIAESVRRDGLLELWPARRDHDRRHPLLDTAPGGAYDRLRAVHDIVSHGWLGHDFDADGEYSAWLCEDRMYTGLARRALATELHGEHSVLWTSGTLADHKAVLLHPALVGASRTSRRSRPPCASS